MGVILQAFYWDCPDQENQNGTWWNYLNSRLAPIRNAGFTALWLPPASKGARVRSMGYDPYDYFDLGDFDQKGGTKTWFGNQAELTALIQAAHNLQISVYADMVLDHNSGADAAEFNPLINETRWTLFNPASGRFPREWKCFHPSPYEVFDQGTFGDMPDLCHRNPYVYTQFIELAQWMVETIGFDGFRLDFVKGYVPWMAKALAELRYLGKAAEGFTPFCVAECWDGEHSIDDWLDAVNYHSDNPVSAFDFPLHYRLKELCDGFGFSLRTLAQPGSVVQDFPFQTVTFVDNHDTIRDPGSAIIADKMLAYAFILTHEGYPSVFWQDYFNYGLARAGTPNGIDALISVHEGMAAGATQVLYADDDLYIMQRSGDGGQPGLVFILNNRGDHWNGATVRTQWPNRRFDPVAWDGRDQSAPQAKQTDADGQSDFYAAPRGFAVYAPR